MLYRSCHAGVFPSVRRLHDNFILYDLKFPKCLPTQTNPEKLYQKRRCFVLADLLHLSLPISKPRWGLGGKSFVKYLKKCCTKIDFIDGASNVCSPQSYHLRYSLKRISPLSYYLVNWRVVVQNNPVLKSHRYRHDRSVILTPLCKYSFWILIQVRHNAQNRKSSGTRWRTLRSCIPVINENKCRNN